MLQSNSRELARFTSRTTLAHHAIQIFEYVNERTRRLPLKGGNGRVGLVPEVVCRVRATRRERATSLVDVLSAVLYSVLLRNRAASWRLAMLLLKGANGRFGFVPDLVSCETT